MKTIFTVTIKIENDSYNFKKGDLIDIPVLTSNYRNAENKVLNKYMSSQYPGFSIYQTNKGNNIFEPII